MELFSSNLKVKKANSFRWYSSKTSKNNICKIENLIRQWNLGYLIRWSTEVSTQYVDAERQRYWWCDIRGWRWSRVGPRRVGSLYSQELDIGKFVFFLNFMAVEQTNLHMRARACCLCTWFRWLAICCNTKDHWPSIDIPPPFFATFH